MDRNKKARVEYGKTEIDQNSFKQQANRKPEQKKTKKWKQSERQTKKSQPIKGLHLHRRWAAARNPLCTWNCRRWCPPPPPASSSTRRPPPPTPPPTPPPPPTPLRSPRPPPKRHTGKPRRQWIFISFKRQKERRGRDRLFLALALSASMNGNVMILFSIWNQKEKVSKVSQLINGEVTEKSSCFIFKQINDV